MSEQIQVRTIITSLMLVILLGALDQTIISVSLPIMAAELQGVELLAWVVSGYLIAMAVATPVYGKLGDIYGRRSVLSSAIVLFLAASVLCALAPSMPILVAARILQGLGGGGLISVAQAAISDVVAPRERGRYQAYISGAFAVASVAGPVLGGVLTSYLSWRWIFWINLPLGIPALILSRRALAQLNRPSVRRKVDYFGAGLLSAGLTGLLLAITRLGQGIALTERSSLILFGLALVLLLGFVVHATRTQEPIIPLDLFRIRTVVVSCALLVLVLFQLVALTVLIPLELQMLTDMGPGGAAWRVIALSLAIPAGAYVGGRLMSQRGRYKYIQLAGALLVPFALFAFSMFSTADLLTSSACLAVLGVGLGLQLPTATVAIQNAVPAKHLGVATGVAAFSRSLGSAMGAAVLMAILLLYLSQAGSALDQMSAAQMIGALVDDAANYTGHTDLGALRRISATAFEKVYLWQAALAWISVALCLYLKNETLDSRAPTHLQPAKHN